MRSTVALGCTVAALLFLVACGGQEAPEERQEVQQDIENLGQQLEESLDDAGRRIDELGDRIGTAGGDGEEALQKTIEDLQQRRDELRQDLEELKGTGEGRTQDLRGNLQRQLYALKQDAEAAYLRTMETREEFERAAEDHLNRLDGTISQFERRLDNVGSDVRPQYREEVAELEVRYDSLTQEFEQVQTAGEQQFEAARAELANRLAALRVDVQQLTNELEQAAADGEASSQ